MNKAFWEAAINRAIRTVAQVLGSTLPVGAPVTVAMIKGFDMNIVWAILAWLATGLLGGLASILTSLATGLPEVNTTTNDVRTIYLDEYGHEISEAEVEEMCPIKVRAYDDYDADGSPKSKDGEILPQTLDEPCEECDLTKYVEGGMNDD